MRMWQKKASTRRLIILAGFLLFLLAAPLVYGVVMEAPAGFDDMTNGFTSQTQFEADKEIFDDFELIGNGLGPVYNAQACRECHQNPVSGSSTQVTELRVGRTDAFGNFFDRRLSDQRPRDPSGHSGAGRRRGHREGNPQRADLAGPRLRRGDF